MIPKKANITNNIETFVRVIATAKEPITAGPEIKYIKKRRKKHFTCNTLKVKCDHRSKFSNLSNWKEEA